MVFLPMSICLKDLFECPGWILPAADGFIVNEKIKRITGAIGDSLSFVCKWSCSLTDIFPGEIKYPALFANRLKALTR